MGSVQDAQEYLQQHSIDCWLIYEYKGINPTLSRVTGP